MPKETGEACATGERAEGGAAHGLAQARAGMRWSLEAGDFALVGFSEPPAAEDLALLAGEGPVSFIREGGESTLLVPAGALAEVVARHPGAEVERDLLWVRFEMAMAWDLVGFLALVTSKLAEAGVPLGAVCGFSRDHLFIARRYEDTLVRVLEELFPTG